MLDATIQVSTEHFDGPLALLLMLVRREEVDIKQLDLLRITKQYLAYLNRMQELNFDIAGEYLYLAATLLQLKSSSCLQDDDTSAVSSEGGELAITSTSELIRRLEELEHFQRMGEKLWNQPKLGHEVFVRPKVNRQDITNSILTPLELAELLDTMMDFMRREQRKYTVVARSRLSIKEKLAFMKSYLAPGREFDFSELMHADGEQSRENMVITFIYLLELAKWQKVKIFQNKQRSNIYVSVIDDLSQFDVNQANSFEPEEQRV